MRRLYGTGMTIYGGRDLLKWDTTHNVTLKSLADGIEETAILGLISPPSGPPLLSAVGDLGGHLPMLRLKDHKLIFRSRICACLLNYASKGLFHQSEMGNKQRHRLRRSLPEHHRPSGNW